MAALTLLYDVNLLTVSAEHLFGCWNIRCGRPAPAPERLWSEGTRVQLGAGVLLLYTPSGVHQGTWQVERHRRQGQPFLVLHLPTGKVQVVVTRLRCSLDERLRQLSLYFPSGLELELELTPF
ncbi:hypothetical protein [Hymenobacter sp. GOD-10R]|uniref:hypothetical protein n=1 Tax=Hymenobacter sp. GOD-10R TaxID=3093922 RepID=UPI002D7A0487|nr:hypothetical protein [Hymenobacter sp. GOD-10R]WRQ31642.1 hypothetical protein SD425_27810 [Hymenobacter sp. GOD-10R]